MAAHATALGVLSGEHAEKREEIVGLLTRAYWMELESVMNYLACSINPDGVRAQEIRDSLVQETADELAHARQFGERIKRLQLNDSRVDGARWVRVLQGRREPR